MPPSWMRIVALGMDGPSGHYDGILSALIIKITISSLVIGLKKSYFPLIHLPSCYRTVCYQTVCYRTVQQTNQIQSCSLNQPII